MKDMKEQVGINSNARLIRGFINFLVFHTVTARRDQLQNRRPNCEHVALRQSALRSAALQSAPLEA